MEEDRRERERKIPVEERKRVEIVEGMTLGFTVWRQRGQGNGGRCDKSVWMGRREAGLDREAGGILRKGGEGGVSEESSDRGEAGRGNRRRRQGDWDREVGGGKGG